MSLTASSALEAKIIAVVELGAIKPIQAFFALNRKGSTIHPPLYLHFSFMTLNLNGERKKKESKQEAP